MVESCNGLLLIPFYLLASLPPRHAPFFTQPPLFGTSLGGLHKPLGRKAQAHLCVTLCFTFRLLIGNIFSWLWPSKGRGEGAGWQERPHPDPLSVLFSMSLLAEQRQRFIVAVIYNYALWHTPDLYQCGNPSVWKRTEGQGRPSRLRKLSKTSSV